MKTNPGGRGKSASYSTATVRVPEPLLAEVELLKQKFYANYVEHVHKPVTTLRKTSPIEELEFSREIYQKLKRGQINTVGELIARHSTGELKTVKNLGRVSLRQIEKRLAEITISN